MPRPFLTQVDDKAAVLVDFFDALVELLATVTLAGMEDVAGQAFGVKTHQRYFHVFPIAQRNHYMLFTVFQSVEGEDFRRLFIFADRHDGAVCELELAGRF